MARNSYVPFKYLDRRRLAYLLNSGLRRDAREREAAELKQQLGFFFLFFFISQHNEMDVSLRASQLLSVQDAGRSLSDRVITCHQSGDRIKRAPRVLLYLVRKNKIKN